MSAKADARRARRAVKEEKRQEKKQLILAVDLVEEKVVVSGEPMGDAFKVLPELTEIDELKSLRSHKALVDRLRGDKIPQLPDGSSLASLPMTWCIRRADIVGAWSWKEERAWSNEEFDSEIATPMEQLRESGWLEILGQTAKGLTRHHSQELASLIKEVQSRWVEIGLEQFDSAFRFRLSGARRLWGVLVDGHFFSIWFDRNHTFYPVALRKT